jgi:uncharacterized protein YbbC (DUF1343 family)
MTIELGLDRLLAEATRLAGRRYGLLAHGASVTAATATAGPRAAHLALAAGAAGPPAALFGPEHGYYGVEQDMVAAAAAVDPLTGAPIVSLYGDSESSLTPRPEAFAGLDLLVIDLQDVGSRYYTYAATAVWAAQVALAAGCEVWVLDRPNPLGGERIEGNLRGAGFESFVGAFEHPVRHGLTLAELVRLELGTPDGLTLWPMAGWRRSMQWQDTGLPWIAPSPNMPTPHTAQLYPGLCLLEATELSEGRGTTRPFQLLGDPGIALPRLLAELDRRRSAGRLDGLAWLPALFRPQFQKHAGRVCAGVELIVTAPERFQPYAAGVELLAALAAAAPEAFAWRQAPYEFVSDRPAIDLLTGGSECRLALAAEGDPTAALDAWRAGWPADEARFRERRRPALLYPEAAG